MSTGHPPVVTFLSDFGLDGAAAICHGVMLSLCPDAQIVDIAHTVPKYSIADGAFILASALPFMPVGVHLAIVDPGVGTQRRPIALQAGRGDLLVGPDNGLLVAGADALGGVVEARELANPELWGPTVSSTFHGRDVFAPVAARLAARTAQLAEVGPVLEAAELVQPPVRRALVRDGWLETEVIYVDSFGNLRLAGSEADLVQLVGRNRRPLGLAIELPDAAAGMQVLESTFVATFGDVEDGAPLVYVDSGGHLALADNRGNAAARLGATTGTRIRIRAR
ncbi:MAG: SAM-dependent chlorinase/fluorinase [Chloroflexota bacterium]|nr:SAM-dependent chlorinase/fluorinase [Chloroflexota bacterium]